MWGKGKARVGSSLLSIIVNYSDSCIAISSTFLRKPVIEISDDEDLCECLIYSSLYTSHLFHQTIQLLRRFIAVPLQSHWPNQAHPQPIPPPRPKVSLSYFVTTFWLILDLIDGEIFPSPADAPIQATGPDVPGCM